MATQRSGVVSNSSYRRKKSVTSRQNTPVWFFFVSHVGCTQEVEEKTLVSQRTLLVKLKNIQPSPLVAVNLFDTIVILQKVLVAPKKSYSTRQLLRS